ncbi:MAG: hypothetical protein IKZ07_06015 [Akkermansia sp.]|nr:hypothetical protein [Akkermansia sp.]
MAAYRRKDGRPLAADETVVLVDLKGFEYCKLTTLARTLDVSVSQMKQLVADFCETHEIRILELGERSQLVNVRDFRRALMDRVNVRCGLRKETV